MRKVSPRLVAIMMASVVSVTSIAPVTAYNHVTVNAAQLQQQAIDWTFTGNGKVDNDKIQLSGAGDNIGITNIKKEDNYAVKAKLAQGEEDGAVGGRQQTGNLPLRRDLRFRQGQLRRLRAGGCSGRRHGRHGLCGSNGLRCLCALHRSAKRDERNCLLYSEPVHLRRHQAVHRREVRACGGYSADAHNSAG